MGGYGSFTGYVAGLPPLAGLGLAECYKAGGACLVTARSMHPPRALLAASNTGKPKLGPLTVTLSPTDYNHAYRPHMQYMHQGPGAFTLM
eukprot:364604-Chlamydomonas_euryale.AAC.11